MSQFKQETKKRGVKWILLFLLVSIVACPLIIWKGTYVLQDDVAKICDKTYLLLKAGTETMESRVPVHMATTLKAFRHHQIYSDSDVPIFGQPVVNIIKYSTKALFSDSVLMVYKLRYREIVESWGWGARNIIIDGRKIGWYVDIFKNIPAYAHAWSHDKSKDWYFMIDDDTFLLPSSFAAAVAGKNPDDVLIIGRNVGYNWFFAYGGSGIVLSRGAMKLMYGQGTEAARAAVDSMHDNLKSNCCGDIAVTDMLNMVANNVHMTPEEYMRYVDFQDDSAIFQGGPRDELIAAFRNWCTPIGSFHHGTAASYNEIFVWAENLRKERGGNYAPTYYDFYERYIMPHVTTELIGWTAYHNAEYGDNAVFHADSPECASADSCRNACENELTCMQWSYEPGSRCVLVNNGVVAGQAKNEYSPDGYGKEFVMGYMPSRIIEHRKNASLVCDPINTDVDKIVHTEGWLYKQFKEGSLPFDLKSLV